MNPQSPSDPLVLVISDDKMSAVIREIAPPEADAPALKAEDVEKALAAKKVVFGIQKEAIEKVVRDVSSTGKPQRDVIVASGQPAVAGVDAQIELKVGKDAVNKDPRAQFFVKAEQILVEKKPATPGEKGTNVFGEKVAGKPGADRPFKAEENVSVSKDKTQWTAAVYGIARLSPNTVSIETPIRISNDKMSAQLEIAPILSDNSTLTLEEVLKTLERSGVVYGIKKDAVEAVLKPGQPVRTLPVAEGTRPKDGVDACVEFKFLLNGKNPEDVDAARKESPPDENTIIKEFVSEGDVLAVKKPLQPPVDGSDVFGKVLSGKQARDKKVGIGPNVRLLEDGTAYVVADGAMGYANWANGTLWAEDPIRVSDDKLIVYLCVHPPSASGKMITRNQVLMRLKAIGIARGVGIKAIESALEKAVRMTEPLRDIRIAKGVPPKKGQDAQFKFSFLAEKTVGESVEGADRLDFKERAAIQNAKKGDVIVDKLPATPGTDGFDVFGNVLRAPPGKDQMLKPADNVKVSDDGLAYTAQIDGMISLFGKDQIGVFKVHQIPGDVNYSTGNLTMDGSIAIKGWIRSGFSVRASGDILVSGGIENAVVEALANVEVKGGIVGRETGRVSAGGDVVAHFIENARVYAGGDIIVRDSIVRSFISAEGHVDATAGKGHIMSGTILAGKGVKANVIGSKGGVKAIIDVGVPPEFRKLAAHSEKQLSMIERKKIKTQFSFSKTPDENNTGVMVAGKTGDQGALTKLKRETVKKEVEQSKYRQLAAEQTAESETRPAKVEVKKMVHEGTKVMVKGYSFPVNKDMPGSGAFILNTEKEVVEYI